MKCQLKICRGTRVATCQGNVGKTKFSPGQGKVRGFCGVTSGNFVMTLFFNWNFHYVIRALPGLCLCKCLLDKYKFNVYWLLLIITVKLLPFKNPGFVGELRFITLVHYNFYHLTNCNLIHSTVSFPAGCTQEIQNRRCLQISTRQGSIVAETCNRSITASLQIYSRLAG